MLAPSPGSRNEGSVALATEVLAAIEFYQE
jgi:hypothetical protein